MKDFRLCIPIPGDALKIAQNTPILNAHNNLKPIYDKLLFQICLREQRWQTIGFFSCLTKMYTLKKRLQQN